VIVQAAYSLAVKSFFFDFKMHSNDEFRRQFLDRKPGC